MAGMGAAHEDGLHLIVVVRLLFLLLFDRGDAAGQTHCRARSQASHVPRQPSKHGAVNVSYADDLLHQVAELAAEVQDLGPQQSKLLQIHCAAEKPVPIAAAVAIAVACHDTVYNELGVNASHSKRQPCNRVLPSGKVSAIEGLRHPLV